MFTKISYTWELMGASWDVLRKSKGMLIYPLCSGICCLLVMASFAFPIVMFGPAAHHRVVTDPNQRMVNAVVFYGSVFLFYFANYFVITFFNTAVVSMAVARMAGGEPTVGGGFREALSRIHLIAGWALVSATVGMLLRMVIERHRRIGAIVASLLGAAWSILTFLVVPVMVVENKGPIAAIKTSSSLLKSKWGEQLTGNFSFGMIFFLLSVAGYAAIGCGLWVLLSLHNLPLGVALIALGALYLVLLALVHSVLVAIFQAAVYMYTQGALVPATVSGQGFPIALVQQAMK